MRDASERQSRLERNAEAYARVAVANVRREFPFYEFYLVTGPGALPLPRQLHPAFYGSADWHSSVEMHWVLARLLRIMPGLGLAPEIRQALDEHLTRDALVAEAAFVSDHAGFERPYGWGWALMLAAELVGWHDRDAQRWREHLLPLVTIIRDRFCEWLPRATYPVRVGLHYNSAFGLTLALPFARSEAKEGRPQLEGAIRDAATRWFAGDADYPAGWEPSGTDFLSPALTEAVLMLELVGRSAFVGWLDMFLPRLAECMPRSLFTPAVVSDITDGQIAHLHGLNLSRGWCMRRIAEALPADDPRVAVLVKAAEHHAAASLGAVVGGDYMAEHWLPAFALLLLS